MTVLGISSAYCQKLISCTYFLSLSLSLSLFLSHLSILEQFISFKTFKSFDAKFICECTSLQTLNLFYKKTTCCVFLLFWSKPIFHDSSPLVLKFVMINV